jgi:hypothetical protein
MFATYRTADGTVLTNFTTDHVAKDLRSIAAVERFRTLSGRDWSQTVPSLVVVASRVGALDQ